MRSNTLNSFSKVFLKLEENMILNQIRKAGYKILVVWQEDFLKDRENETKRIIEFAKS